MNKKFIRILFIIVTIFLFVQFYFSIKISEPYPAIIYPAFRKVSDNSIYNSYLIIEVEVIFKNRDKVYITDRELLSGIDPVVRWKLLSSLLNSNNDLNIVEDQQKIKIKSVFRNNLKKKYSKEPVSVKLNMTKIYEYYRNKPIKKHKKVFKSVMVRL